MKKKKEKIFPCECGHEIFMHADPKRHELGTSHCTAEIISLREFCSCNKFRERK